MRLLDKEIPTLIRIEPPKIKREVSVGTRARCCAVGQNGKKCQRFAMLGRDYCRKHTKIHLKKSTVRGGSKKKMGLKELFQAFSVSSMTEEEKAIYDEATRTLREEYGEKLDAVADEVNIHLFGFHMVKLWSAMNTGNEKMVTKISFEINEQMRILKIRHDHRRQPGELGEGDMDIQTRMFAVIERRRKLTEKEPLKLDAKQAITITEKTEENKNG